MRAVVIFEDHPVLSYGRWAEHVKWGRNPTYSVLSRDAHAASLTRNYSYAHHPLLFRVVNEQGWQVPEEEWDAHRFIVAPYAAPTNPFLRDATRDSDLTNILLFFRGSCNNPARTHFHISLEQLWKSAPESMAGVDATCTAGAAGNANCDDNSKNPSCRFWTGMTGDELLKLTASATFCAVLPGDTWSSSRLTETINAGCLPLFIGPDWHTLPLIEQVAYARFSIFALMPPAPEVWEKKNEADVAPMKRMLSAAAAAGATLSGRGDRGAEGVVADVPSFAELIKLLRAIPPARIAAMRRAMREYMKFFAFASLSDIPSSQQRSSAATTSPPPHATAHILAAVCDQLLKIPPDDPAVLAAASKMTFTNKMLDA
jgi:hypothetical protein